MDFSKYFSLSLLLLAGANVHSQAPFQEQNLHNKYDINGAMTIHHKVFPGEDSLTIYLAIFPNTSTSTNWKEDYSLTIEFKKDYQTTESGLSQSVSLDDHFLGEQYNYHIFRFNLPSHKNLTLLEAHLKYKSWGEDFLHDINVDEDHEYGNAGLMLCDSESELPVFSSFINDNTSVKIKAIDNPNKAFWVYHYATDFDVAIPPMIVDNANVTRSLDVANTYQISFDSTLSFSEEGLYFVQSDTNSLEGVGFRVQHEPFPRLGTYEELIKPVRFISTKTESEEIVKDPGSKKIFETFWIENTSSLSVAQNSIKNYYRRVSEANFFFTGYKEGWKTDMGMIYIIYGSPDKVFKHEEYEQWIYNQNVNMPAIRFTFVKIKNVFSTNHFTLVRDRKYDKHWFRAVELWRTGKK